jgi:myo-inositol-1-phosphate synthase
VIGFDIDARKVGRSLREAIYSPPNCNHAESSLMTTSSASSVLRRESGRDQSLTASLRTCTTSTSR